MNHPDTPKDGEFAQWIEGKSEALKFELGKKFPISPTTLGAPATHLEPGAQNIEEVLLGHEQPSAEFMDELSALENAPPVSEEELARQALQAGGADNDSSTPE